jgi:hypothetical protein
MQYMFVWILTSAVSFVLDHLPDFMDIDYYLFNLKEKISFLHVLVAPSITNYLLPITKSVLNYSLFDFFD